MFYFLSNKTTYQIFNGSWISSSTEIPWKEVEARLFILNVVSTWSWCFANYFPFCFALPFPDLYNFTQEEIFSPIQSLPWIYFHHQFWALSSFRLLKVFLRKGSILMFLLSCNWWQSWPASHPLTAEDLCSLYIIFSCSELKTPFIFRYS